MSTHFHLFRLLVRAVGVHLHFQFGSCDKDDMVIETRTIPVWKDGNADSQEAPQEFVDALDVFAKSRATRRLLREVYTSDVHCALLIPLFVDCRVRPQEFARTLRKLYREVIAAANPGERFTINLYVDAKARLAMEVVRDA